MRKGDVKMDDVSNRTLAILVGIAIMVSLVGLFVGKGKITGMATEENVSGNITLTISSFVDINATDRSINFAQMVPDQTNNSENANDNITVVSLGSTIVDIEYWANNSLFKYKNGTTESFNPCCESDQSYKMRVMLENCTGDVASGKDSYDNVSIGFGNMTEIVTECEQTQGLTIGVAVCVPHYEKAGSKRSEIYFRATEH